VPPLDVASPLDNYFPDFWLLWLRPALDALTPNQRVQAPRPPGSFLTSCEWLAKHIAHAVQSCSLRYRKRVISFDHAD
jgi:hypothetical protein